jgi:hypothetical protein
MGGFMKKNIDLNADKSKEFMRYFYSMQKTNQFEILEGNGTAYWNSNNEYEVYHNISFEYKKTEVFINWKVLYNKKGELISIECINEEDMYTKDVAEDIIQKSYENVINEKRNEYFNRSYYLTVSGCNLVGEYWFKDFRFAPLFSDDTSHIVNAERIVVIDQNVMAVDKDHSNEIAVENAENYISLLSFIIDIPLEKPRIVHKYFLDEQDFAMKRMNTQIHDDSNITMMPNKNEICETKRFIGSVFDDIKYTNEILVVPKEARKIVNGVITADVKFKNTVLKACKLYRVARSVAKTYKTAMLSYECAAVESIVKNMGYKSFTEFMTTYAGPNKKLYDFIYSNVRSGHFHAGEFPFLDFNLPSRSLDDFSYRNLWHIEDISHKKMRYAILMWLNEELSFISKTKI